MGGDAPKQEISQQEIAQAINSAERWNERIDDGFLELEKQGIRDAQRDHSGYIGGRSSADLAQQESEGLRQLAAGGGTAQDFADFGNSIAEAETTQDVDTGMQAQSLRDKRMVGMSKVGQDVALNTESGLRSAAQLGNSRASEKVQNKILVDNAKFGAKMQALSGAMQGAGLRSEGFRVGKGGLQKTHERGLNGESLGLRGDALDDHLSKGGNRIGWGAMAGSL